jgi:hypothetical protein
MKTFIFLVFIILITVWGVTNDPMRPSYFNGAAYVHYTPDKLDHHSYLIFYFLKTGNYDISFQAHPDEKSEESNMHPGSNLRKNNFGLPENFSVVIRDTTEKIVKVADLRGIFRVTIKRNGEEEFHDFAH